jgi:hypothetical protein
MPPSNCIRNGNGLLDAKGKVLVGNSSLRGVTEDLPVTCQRHGRGSYFGVRTTLRLRTVQNDLWTVTFIPAILNVLRTRIRAAHLAWSMSS